MDNKQIIYILNIFAQHEHCFTFEDLLNYAQPDSDSELIKNALLNDSGFIVLNKENSSWQYLQAHFVFANDGILHQQKLFSLVNSLDLLDLLLQRINISFP